MKAAWYIRCLSYIYEIPIEKKESAYSGTLELTLHRGNWKLSTKNAIYSFGNHYTSFKIAFEKLDIQQYTLPKILILGAGIGSISQLLSKQKGIQQMDIVDIDPVIIELAKKYWSSPRGVQLHFYTADAYDWLKNRKDSTPYDLILSDVFIDDQTPENMLSENYLLALRNNLQHNGILIYSKLDYNKVHKKANQVFEKTFFKVFPIGFSIQAKYNKMYIQRN